jgi:hypothetical protein
MTVRVTLFALGNWEETADRVDLEEQLTRLWSVAVISSEVLGERKTALAIDPLAVRSREL